MIFTKWPDNKEQPPAPSDAPSEKLSSDVSAPPEDGAAPSGDQSQHTTSDPTILQATYSVPISSSKDTATQSLAQVEGTAQQGGGVVSVEQGGSSEEAPMDKRDAQGQATEKVASKPGEEGVTGEEESKRSPIAGGEDAPVGVAKTTPPKEKSIRQAWDEKQSDRSPCGSPAVRSAGEPGEALAVEDFETSDPQQGPEGSILPPPLPPQVRHSGRCGYHCKL